jgi:hypothetical protein
MSYVIHLFEHPGSATLAEADALHEQLSDTEAPDNAKFIQLAKALVALYPEEVGGGEEGNPEWTECVPEGLTGGSAVYSLGLYDQGITELPMAIVRLALPLGLCVYDDQAALCYVPGGFVLTHSGKHALDPAQLKSPAPAKGPKPLAPGTLKWTAKILLERIGAGIAHTGFQGRAKDVFVKFSRVTDAGLQIFQLTISRGTQVCPWVELEPMVPHALYRIVRPGRGIDCFAPTGSALQPFFCNPREVLLPGRDRIFELVAGSSEEQMGQLAQALTQFFLNEYLPLLDACRDVPSIVRHVRDRPALAAYAKGNRNVLALVHWLGEEDVLTFAELVAERDFKGDPSPARYVRESARELAELRQYKGTWRPGPAACRLPTAVNDVSQAMLAKAVLKILDKVTSAHGFSKTALPKKGHYLFERQSAQVHQRISADLKGGRSFNAQASLEFDWYSPALWNYWKALLAPWGQDGASRLKVAWDGVDLEANGVDTLDLGIDVDRVDYLADYLEAFEAGLEQTVRELLNPALQLSGLAAQLLLEPEVIAQHINRYRSGGFEKCAAKALLAGCFRPDWLEAHGDVLLCERMPKEDLDALAKIVAHARTLTVDALASL